jgi:hypothetical protein
MTNSHVYNPLALTDYQKKCITESAHEYPFIRLTTPQIVHLQKHGLLADAHETYEDPDGAFILLPRFGGRRRIRVNNYGDK